MSLFRTGWVRWGLAVLTLSVTSRADDTGADVVWYRGSVECPSGPEFLEKLGVRAARARLAGAGDHIDFIVTLVATQGETVGRLERQTQTGTVAIRELRDASCESVASALVLSLGLALDPQRRAELPTEPSVPEASTPVPAPPAVEQPAASEPATPAPSAAPPAVDAARPAPRREQTRWSLGAHGGVVSGITPSALAAVSAFVDVDGLPFPSRQASLRAGFAGAFGASDTAVGSVDRSILAGRLEGCPLRWGDERWSIRPCLFVEVGATTAASSRETTLRGWSPWVAPGISLRAAVDVVGPLGFEATAGGLLPLVRNDISAGNNSMYRDGVAAFEARLGAFVRLR